MTTRTAAEVGEILRRRREAKRYVQTNIPGVSSATVGKIERGAADSFRRTSLLAYLTAIEWPADAYERLADGADPADLDGDQPEPEAARIVALAGRLTPEQRARVEGFMEALLGDNNGGSR